MVRLIERVGFTPREVLALAALNDRRTPREISERFGVSVWAIYKREQRAKAKLKAAGLHLHGNDPRRHGRTRPSAMNVDAA